jgi:receptor protein-tyrosine kinase
VPSRQEGAAKRPARAAATISLNFQRLRQQGLITPDVRRSKDAEEFRLIKSRLLKRLDAPGAPPRSNVILVTSCRPKEGKTFTSLNLALSLAMDEKRSVTLVDGDVVRPRVLAALGLPPAPGLTDLLRNPASLALDDVLLQCDNLALGIVPAGSPVSSATELFAGEVMANLTLQMSERTHDGVVIFDSPPVLATTEAAALARLAGQVVMVVEAGKTSESTVQRALDILEPEIDKIAFVLNRCIAGGILDQFSYYYYDNPSNPATRHPADAWPRQEEVD